MIEGTTLTPEEAVKMAAHMWDIRWRKLMGKKMKDEGKNLDTKTRFTPSNGLTAAIKTTDTETVIPSKILMGSPWAELDERERFLIAKAFVAQMRAIRKTVTETAQ